MRIHRVYVDCALSEGLELVLPEAQSRHVSRVLRMRVGEDLHLFNGRGACHRARLTDIGRRQVAVSVSGVQDGVAESPLRITLLQGLSRGRHMDYTIQKSVELGVAAIVPLLTEHGNARPDSERVTHRLEHWRGIIISACEQCGRNRIPELAPPVALDQWRGADTAELRLVLDPQSRCGLAECAAPAKGVTLMCGPEGGLSESDLEQAAARGFVAIALGPRILRTETAAVAAITACQTLWGDMTAAPAAAGDPSN